MCPYAYACGQIGHFSSSCPERRNPSYRSQNQPQQRSQGQSYSGSPGYNQPRDNYRSFPSQNRGDQRLAVLGEGWYDDDFVAQFTQSPFEQASSGTDIEPQQASESQEHIEIRSNGTVVFSKQRPQNAVNLHNDATLQQSLMSPSTYAAIRSQSLSAQPEVKQPPLPGIFCFSPGSTNSQAISVTSSADQPPANVNTNLLLESILHATQDLNFNQTQAPALNDNPTQALSDDKQSGIDAFVTNSLTSGQYSAVPEIIPEDTQPNTDNTDLVYHSTPAVNNSQNTELLIDPDTNFNMVHDVPNLAPSSTTPKGDKAVVSNHRQVSRTAPVASSSPDSIRDPSFQDSVRDPSSQAHPKEPEAVHTSGISTTSIIQGELDVPLNDSLLYTTQDGEATPLSPVSAQQDTFHQLTEPSKEFQPQPPVLQQKLELVQAATRRVHEGPSQDRNTARLAAYAEHTKREIPDFRQEICKVEDKLEERCLEMDARIQALTAAEPYSNFREVNTSRKATFPETNKRETPEVTEEIRRMERRFTNKLENLYQRVRRIQDNRINSLALSNQVTRPELADSRERNRQSRPVCYKCGRVGHIQYNCYYYRPEDQHNNQGETQEHHTRQDQEETQQPKPQSSARLYALDAQYARRVQDYHHKTENPALETQTSRQPVRTCRLNFEGEENSSDHTIAVALPKRDKTTADDQQRKERVSLSYESTATLNFSDLTVEGKIAGQTVQLLVDTGACVSAIDEQLFTKIYGQSLPKMTDGSLSSVQTVNGEEVSVLGKISVPLQLHGREYFCKFHVMQNLTYDAILGRDFLQNNGAQIDLVDSTLSFKAAGRPRKPSSTTSVPVMGSFLPSSRPKKFTVKKTVTTHVDPAPFAKILVSKLVHRSEKNKEMAFHRSLLVLILLLYLLTASHAQKIDSPAIQKQPKFFVPGTPDDILGDTQRRTPVTHSKVIDLKDSDHSMESKETKEDKIKVLKTVEKTLKPTFLSPFAVDQNLQEDDKRDVFDAISTHPGDQVPYY